MIDTLKRFWRQNWHKIASAFSILAVVCAIAFSCGVNSKALEITPYESRYIDVSIRQTDYSETVEVNYELSPPLGVDPNIYFTYPVVNWNYYQDGIVLDSSGLYTFDDGLVESSVSHLVYVDSDGSLAFSPTVTYFELDEFSALPSVLASGQDADEFALGDPYSYIQFRSDAYCTADIKLTIARSASNGSLTYIEAYYYDTQYYLAEYYSLYYYLLENIESSNFTVFSSSGPSAYNPSQGEFISSVTITTYDGYFNVFGASQPQFATTEITHREYFNSDRNLTTIVALLRGSSIIDGSYAQGYADGRNSAITENLGIVDWLIEAGDSVMNFQLFAVGDTPITIGSIFTVILGSLLIIFILKVFAGG